MSDSKLTGSCHCKAIAFEVANVGSEPAGGIVCHCQVRRRARGLELWPWRRSRGAGLTLELLSPSTGFDTLAALLRTPPRPPPSRRAAR
jgi:hypothetical protein